MDESVSCTFSAKSNEVKNSLKTIMRMLHAVYGKKVILLIDEYDVPLANAIEKDTQTNKYYTSMLDVIKGIMSTALKNNEFLEFAVITGCLRIAKESIFTGTNNFASFSVLDEDFTGIFVGRGYHVESNKEKGLGRPDILLKDKRNRRAIIIEAKKSKKESDMDKDCNEAVIQIVTEKYAEEKLIK